MVRFHQMVFILHIASAVSYLNVMGAVVTLVDLWGGAVLCIAPYVHLAAMAPVSNDPITNLQQ